MHAWAAPPPTDQASLPTTATYHARSPCARLRVRLRIQPLPLALDRSAAAAAAFLPSSPPAAADDLLQRASCSMRPTTCLRHRVTPTRLTCSTATMVVVDDDLAGAAALCWLWLSHVALPLSSNLMEMKESFFFHIRRATESLIWQADKKQANCRWMGLYHRGLRRRRWRRRRRSSSCCPALVPGGGGSRGAGGRRSRARRPWGGRCSCSCSCFCGGRRRRSYCCWQRRGGGGGDP
uniref:Uncharacterized protein n=1 Tax=Zea mays TaxID=4577 RepID=C4J2Z7_MAIZE|nr:unknown [Zea mays]